MKNTLLFLLCIALLSCNDDSEQLEAINENGLSENTISGELNTENGMFISSQKGAAKVEYYNLHKEEKDILETDSYYWGINKVKDFLVQVEEFEKRLDKGDKVIGVRLHRVVSSNSETGERYYDIMMVPVTKNGYDILNNDNNEQLRSTNEDPILNYSSPCPTECN